MTKVGILDDEVVICETIKKHLSKLGYDVPDYAMSYEEGIALIEQHQPDIMLLDVNIGGDKTGIDFAAYLRKNHNIPLIFVTSYSDIATVSAAKNTEPNGYLLKPFSAEDLYVAIEAALSSFSSTQKSSGHDAPLTFKPLSDSLFIKQDQLFVKVKFEEISFVKSEGVYLEIYAAGKRMVIRETLKNLSDILPHEDFHQPHRSYIIRLSAIDAVNPEFVIIGNTSIPIARSHRDEFLNRLNLL
jgi:two-component system, LytTR family, response regulator LytT